MTYTSHLAHRPSPWLLTPATLALALLGLAHRDVVFPSLCFLGIVGSYFHSWHVSQPKRHPWFASMVTCVALFFLCLLYYWVGLFHAEGLTSLRRFWYKPWLVNTGAMLQAAVLLWAWHLPHRSTGLIFACLGLIAIASGNLLPSSYGIVNLYALLGGACLLSLLVLSGALYGGRDQPFWEQCRQSIVILACIVIIGAGTWYLSTNLPHVGHVLETWFADWIPGAHYRDTIGAGDSIRIAHQRHVRLSHRVVATLSGSQSPVYLRTQVMTRYQDHRWTPTPSLPLRPLKSYQRQNARHTRTTQDADHREVRLHVNLRGTVPLPYNVTQVRVPELLSCLQTAEAIVQCTPSSQLTSYAFESAKPDVPIPFGIGFAMHAPDPEASLSALAQSLQEALSGPEAVLSQLRPLARQITGTETSHALATAQKIQQHFRQHFSYSLDVKLSPELDPIVDFIRHRRPAYCEYFASGMALMLRALGIPARVVGGFLVREYNGWRQQWIVRQRDAHAWVEVYDDMGQRWIGFDATPAFRQEQFSHTGLAGFWDQSRAWTEWQVRTVVKRLYQIDFIAWLIRLPQLQTGFVPIASCSLMLAVLIASVYWFRRRLHRAIHRCRSRHRGWQRWRWPGRRRPSSISEAVRAEAQQHFARLAALLQRRGTPILPTETLEEYLDRCQNDQEGPSTFIDLLTDFSHAYHSLRFRPGSAAPETRQLWWRENLLLIRQAMEVELQASGRGARPNG